MGKILFAQNIYDTTTQSEINKLLENMLNYLIRILSFQLCVKCPADRPLTCTVILRGENAPKLKKLPYKKWDILMCSTH